MDSLTRATFIEQRASEALDKTGQSKAPTDLDAIARHYGISVVRGQLAAGVVAHFDAARNEIVLGDFDRWPLAHELGHALLRHGNRNCYEGAMASDVPLVDADVGVPFEAEANRFARHVLVPKPWLELLFSRGWKPPELARRFQVSDVVLWRALTAYRLV
jgi:hypothetical protein